MSLSAPPVHQPTGVDAWLLRREAWRPLLLASIAIRVLFLLGPFDVLDPVHPWELGRSLWRGEMPYRDFPLEYPPVALVAFLLPGAGPRGLSSSVLALQMFALEASLLALFRGSTLVVRRYLLLSLPLVPFLSGGFDAIPMVALAWGAVLLSRGDGRGWVAGAAGLAVKLFPGVLWGTSRHRLGAAAVALLVAVGTLLAPLAVADFDDTPLGYHSQRGVQNESVAASLTFALHAATGEDNVYAYRFRSNEIDGADGTAAAMLVIGGLVAAALAVVSLRRNHLPDVPRDALALLVVLLCASSVLSPQFVAFGAPLAALVGGRTFLHYLPVSALSFVPFFVDNRRSDLFVASAAIRNLFLVALAVELVRSVLRGPATSLAAQPSG